MDPTGSMRKQRTKVPNKEIKNCVIVNNMHRLESNVREKDREGRKRRKEFKRVSWL